MPIYGLQESDRRSPISESTDSPAKLLVIWTAPRHVDPVGLRATRGRWTSWPWAGPAKERLCADIDNWVRTVPRAPAGCSASQHPRGGRSIEQSNALPNAPSAGFEISLVTVRGELNTVLEMARQIVHEYLSRGSGREGA